MLYSPHGICRDVQRSLVGHGGFPRIRKWGDSPHPQRQFVRENDFGKQKKMGRGSDPPTHQDRGWGPTTQPIPPPIRDCTSAMRKGAPDKTNTQSFLTPDHTPKHSKHSAGGFEAVHPHTHCPGTALERCRYFLDSQHAGVGGYSTYIGYM